MRAVGGGLLATLLACVVGGCSAPQQDDNATRPASATASAAAPGWSYVALGDSWAYGGHCGGCKTFVGRYADRLNAKSGHAVVLTNLTHNGGTSADMRKEVAEDPSVRQKLAGADIVVIEVGVNDLDQTGTLDKVAAGTCGGSDGYDCLREQARLWNESFEAIADTIDELRGDRPTAVRYVTSQNVFISDPTIAPEYGIPDDFGAKGGRFLTDALTAANCKTAQRHHAVCVDVARMFNGPNGDQPRDENTSASMDDVTQALVDTGLAELTDPAPTTSSSSASR